MVMARTTCRSNQAPTGSLSAVRNNNLVKAGNIAVPFASIKCRCAFRASSAKAIARSARLPEVLRLLLHLEADLVAAGSVLLTLHRLDHGCKPLDALDQRVLVFPLQ